MSGSSSRPAAPYPPQQLPHHRTRPNPHAAPYPPPQHAHPSHTIQPSHPTPPSRSNQPSHTNQPYRRPPLQQTPNIYANTALRESARTQVSILLSRPHPSLRIPDTIGAYYAVVPLDSAPSPAFGRSGGPPTLPYKAVSAARGTPTTLLRVVGAPPAPSAQIARASDAWRRVRHPALLPLCELFTTRQFSAAARASRTVLPANEVVLAYDFAPTSDTLHNVFLAAMPLDHRYHPLAEQTLWAIATQLLSALATVHASRLSLRDALSPTRVLVTGRNRVRVSAVALSDAFDPHGADHVPGPPSRPVNTDRATALQRADLASLGMLLATLALRIDAKYVRAGLLMVPDDVAVDAIRTVCPYSDDFALLVATLCGAVRPGAGISTHQILAMVGPRMALEMGNVWTHCDSLQNKLFVEFDSSRMFRLMALLGFVNERADAGVEPQWSETGDRYLLKLFRDYVFHRVDENGNAVLDMAHVVECLSRLDVGSTEQVMLSSRDGASLLVATYEDLRRCLMQSVDELREAGHRLPAR